MDGYQLTVNYLKDRFRCFRWNYSRWNPR